MKNPIVIKILAFVGSIVMSALLFLSIPITNFIKLNVIQAPEAKKHAIAPQAQKLPPKKPKTPPKKLKPPPKAKPKAAPKSIARSKFAMDLGPGGGSGGAVIGGGGGLDQMSYEEGETDTSPVAMRTPAPDYPEEALKQGVSGLVRMRIVVTPQGGVDMSSIDFLETPGDYGFEDAIRKVLPNWKFKPATVDGIPVATKMEFPLEF